MDKVVEMKNSVEDYENEKKVLEQKLQDKDSECNLLKEMNERLNMAVKEQEFSIQSMTEKLSSLSQYINSDHSSSTGTMDINQILADSEAMFSKARDLYRERDETLLALNQSKQENQNLRNEMQRMKSTEIHLKSELERLRQHLLEIEENYTSEAVKAEEKQKRLQDELVEVRRRAEITSTAVVDTNQRASIQIASLQEQLSMIANQRDEALAQSSSLEDQVLQHSTSVGKLQLVLEQMQRAHERKVRESRK
ncbi:thyroid receptor-interacting protein 11 [Caerostris extrusa]|uniref:Thyroid receptor-interacting protein 11 n=1 Tax=Caerostris extrusa TaxID=172846 RepID=A0AAV4XRL5_CAEEX|nr:thyroid receptor-interacting protein 11 [Caerostris extrusa]